MKKLAITLLASTALTSVFAAPKSSTSALYPLDSFNPHEFTASNIKEFVKKYSSEADVIVKKGEFETTAEYRARLAKGIQTKSLDSDKIYAFKLDSISVTYDPDEAQYNVDSDGGILLSGYASRENYDTRILISNVSPKGYVKKNIYIESSKPFYNVNYGDLTFSTDIEVAKKNASCTKQVYVFAKLNGKIYQNSPYNAPPNGFRRDYTIPMDVVGMVLKCSTGTVLSVYDSSENNEPKPVKNRFVIDEY